MIDVSIVRLVKLTQQRYLWKGGAPRVGEKTTTTTWYLDYTGYTEIQYPSVSPPPTIGILDKNRSFAHGNLVGDRW